MWLLSRPGGPFTPGRRGAFLAPPFPTAREQGGAGAPLRAPVGGGGSFPMCFLGALAGPEACGPQKERV